MCRGELQRTLFTNAFTDVNKAIDEIFGDSDNEEEEEAEGETREDDDAQERREEPAESSERERESLPDRFVLKRPSSTTRKMSFTAASMILIS